MDNDNPPGKSGDFETEIQEKDDALQSLLWAALATVGERGILIDFQRGLADCRDHVSLAAQVIATAAAYNIDVHVQIRGKRQSITWTRDGPASPLDESVIKHAGSLERIFQFQHRLVVNFPAVSVLAMNMPDDDGEHYRRMRDNVIILAEEAQSAADVIDVWSESCRQIEDMQAVSFKSHYAVESLKLRYCRQQQDVRLMLQQLIDNLEGNFVFLGLTESQEATLSNSVRDAAEDVLTLLEQGQDDFEAKLGVILKLLKPERKGDVQLF